MTTEEKHKFIQKKTRRIPIKYIIQMCLYKNYIKQNEYKKLMLLYKQKTNRILIINLLYSKINDNNNSKPANY
jgi:hypothetical protein